ncbi:MAG: Gldg family protein [Deltaproteobacteria bacterium]|nr:Gldg family protein [Deltaproteobacteria bacterium]
MATTTKSGRSARTNAVITALSVLGILVLLNVLGLWVFGKLDLTDNQRYTLSAVSREAVQDLDSVNVQLFLSEELPPTLSTGWGRERDIRGVDREFGDKLEEYRSYSGGNMQITRVTEDIEKKAGEARLELFTGKEAEVEGGMLEFKKYAIGATFQYRNQMEVFPLAVEPAHFEFEITRILLRLKEKYEKSAGMQDLLDAGKVLADGAQACHDKLLSYEKGAEGGAGGLSVLVGGGEAMSALRLDRDGFRSTCGKVAAGLGTTQGFKGRNEYLDQLTGSATAYAEMVEEISKRIDDPQTQDRALAGAVERLKSLNDLVAKDNRTLKNSPGRKSIGFLCGHGEFCPFREAQPLIRPEIAGLMGQRNPLVQQFVGQAKQIEDQINAVNDQIRRGVFTQRGLALKRVNAGVDIPDDVEVLVVYGAQESLSDRDLYNLDQFLLSGRSVIIFLKNWNVSVYNIKKGGDGFDMRDLSFDELSRKPVAHGLDDILGHYGVDVRHDLVAEPRSFEALTVIQLQKQGQFTLQSQRRFPYPLLPTFSELDRTHVLVRRLASVTLPYVSTLALTEAASKDPDLETVELIRSSDGAVATDQPLRLAPPELLQQLGSLEPNGPHTVALVLAGGFKSFFQGKEVPARPEKPAADPRDPKPPEPDPVDRPFRDGGNGRLLVIGSDLGLENLSSERIFEGFNMGQLTSGTADFFMKLKDYMANFQNWQLRLSQISPIIQANLDFLFNCLDWGVQNEALVDIRSKGFVRRPIDSLSTGVRTAITLGLVVGLPALFILGGVLRFATRRKRS